MKATRTLALLILPLLVAVAGCSDDPTSSDDGRTRKEILTAKPWRTTRATLNGADITPMAQKLTAFATDGTYVATNPDNSTEPGVWEFSSDEKRLLMDKGTDTEVDWEIVELTGSSLKVRATATLGGSTLTSELNAVPQ